MKKGDAAGEKDLKGTIKEFDGCLDVSLIIGLLLLVLVITCS